MAYITINEEKETSIIEKKSEFISHIKRVNSEEEAKTYIEEIRSKYRDARHNCYAYIIGEKEEIQRYSDDKEPQGTAGLPILDVLKKNDLKDVCLIVTRYFGGILLGASGLTRAYAKSASEVVSISKK